MTAVIQSDRIWFNPPKFWAATKHLPREQVDLLMEELLFLAEKGDVRALRKFDFIKIGDPERGHAA